MIKNLFKIFIIFAMMSGFAFAQDFDYVKASHILVKSEAEAIQIKKAIDDGGDFSYYAKNYSECPSGRNGGDLGYFKHGQMVKAFETTAFNLPVGQVSEPVQTQFGWHLIRVEDKR